MPYYSYTCQDCGARFRTFLTYEDYEAKTLRCPKCDSAALKRMIGRIRVNRSEDSRMDSLESMADPAALAGLEDDPQSMGRMMREMGKEMGEDLGPEFNEVVNRLEKGESPEDIEASMPELGEDLGSGMGGGVENFDEF
jgi:putative FmdB family regulatory protein